MKKIFLVTLMLYISMFLPVYCKITEFLGLPVDRTKKEMIQKLREKGFEESSIGDLKGEFNGEYVYLYILTNNNKVYCIALADQNSRSEEEIRIRFNTLCTQFENNGKYEPLPKEEGNNQRIASSEDISNKINHTAFYIYPFSFEDCILQMDKTAQSLYGKNLSEISDKSEETNIIEKAKEEAFNERINNYVNFTIQEAGYKKYRIMMFYKNLLNQSKGEDL